MALYRVGTHVSLAVGTSAAGTVLALPVLIAIILAAQVGGNLSLIPLGILLFVAVLPCPALAGVHVMARALMLGEDRQFRQVWGGVGQFLAPASRLWFVGVVISSILVLNVAFYGGLLADVRPVGIASGPLELVWSSLLVLWLAMHVYVFPLILTQERPTVWLTYRNALVIVLARPLFTVAAGILWLGVLLLSVTTGLAVILGFLFCAAFQEETLHRIAATFQGGAAE